MSEGFHEAVVRNCQEHAKKHGKLDVKTFDTIYDTTKNTMSRSSQEQKEIAA